MTFVAHVNGSHACYRTRTGVDRAFIGCHHATPREAIAHTERKEDTDGLLRPSLAPQQTRTSGLLIAADGPRRPAPTDLVPPGPVGAPSPERVP